MIALRPWREGDAVSAASWGHDPEIVRWTGVEKEQSVERTLDFIRFTRGVIAEGRGFYFVICVGGDLAGSIDLRLVDREDPRIGEIGYLVASGFRRQGVASRALRLLVDWSFGEPLALERVQLMTHPANEASAAVLRSLGFTNEGLLRAFRAEPAGREDRLMWSMLPIDWKAS